MYSSFFRARTQAAQSSIQSKKQTSTKEGEQIKHEQTNKRYGCASVNGWGTTDSLFTLVCCLQVTMFHQQRMNCTTAFNGVATAGTASGTASTTTETAAKVAVGDLRVRFEPGPLTARRPVHQSPVGQLSADRFAAFGPVAYKPAPAPAIEDAFDERIQMGVRGIVVDGKVVAAQTTKAVASPPSQQVGMKLSPGQSTMAAMAEIAAGVDDVEATVLALFQASHISQLSTEDRRVVHETTSLARELVHAWAANGDRMSALCDDYLMALYKANLAFAAKKARESKRQSKEFGKPSSVVASDSGSESSTTSTAPLSPTSSVVSDTEARAHDSAPIAGLFAATVEGPILEGERVIGSGDLIVGDDDVDDSASEPKMTLLECNEVVAGSVDLDLAYTTNECDHSSDSNASVTIIEESGGWDPIDEFLAPTVLQSVAFAVDTTVDAVKAMCASIKTAFETVLEGCTAAIRPLFGGIFFPQDNQEVDGVLQEESDSDSDIAMLEDDGTPWDFVFEIALVNEQYESDDSDSDIAILESGDEWYSNDEF